jgi:preprotein translocase subunit SecE
MASKAELQESRGDSIKLVSASVLVLIAIGGFYYFSTESLLYRVVSLLVAAGIAVGITYQTMVGRRAWAFVQDSRTEVRKVVWPSRNETVQTSLIVLLIVILAGIFLWLLDMFLAWGFRLLTGMGG